MASVRSAVLDDTSSRLAYSGGWSLKEFEADDVFVSGRLVNLTSHVLTSTPASIKFEFEGTSILTVSDGDDTSVNATCLLDGIEAQCDTKGFYQSGLSAGRHEVIMNFAPMGNSAPSFTLDYVQYDPISIEDSVMATEGDMVFVLLSDKNVTMDAGWGQPGPSNYGRSANQTGSEMTFSFTGVGVVVNSVFGESQSSTTSTYILDNGEPVQFDIPRSTDFTFDYPLVQIHNLPFQTHTLKLRYTGDPGRALLNVHDFLVYHSPAALSQDSSIPGNATGTGGDGTGNVPGDETGGKTSSGRPTAGVIAGAVVGGVLGLLLLLALCFVLKRRRQQKVPDSQPIAQMETGIRAGIVNPFLDHQTNRHPPKRSQKHSENNPELKETSTSSQSHSRGARNDEGVWSTGDNESGAHSNSSGSNLGGHNEGDVIHHLDSGIRLPKEVPPSYTMM